MNEASTSKSGKLTLLFGHDYDRIRPLHNGRVRVEGVDLRFEFAPSTHEIFHTLCRSDEYDGGELSFSFYSTLVSKYGAENRLVALPVFISRMFRHGNLLVNAKAGIKTPKDLEGRKVALPEYGMTMGVWLRGILRHHYGVNTDSITWITGRPPAALLPSELRYPENVSITQGAVQKRLLQDLEEGAFDACIAPTPPELPPNVRRLFPDYAKEERDYYAKTAIFPIMHLLVLRRAAYERNLSAVNALYKAFLQAKNIALQDMWETSVLRVSLPWLISAVEEQTAAFGGDPWPYGVERNRKTIEAYLSYANEQGLLWRPLSAHELFAPVQED